jgi:hypothetical protein
MQTEISLDMPYYGTMWYKLKKMHLINLLFIIWTRSYDSNKNNHSHNLFALFRLSPLSRFRDHQNKHSLGQFHYFDFIKKG